MMSEQVRLIKGERNPYALEEERKRREARHNNASHETWFDRRRARHELSPLGRLYRLVLRQAPR